MSGFYAAFFDTANSALGTYTNGAVAGVASAVSGVVTSALTIYVILHGLSIMYGKIQEPIADSIFRLIRVAAIAFVAFHAANYNVYVANVATQTPDEIAAVFVNPGSGVGTNAGTAVNVLDQAFDAGWAAGKQFFAAFSLLSASTYYYLVIGILVWVATLLLTLYGAFLFLLAKIAIAIIVALGPIFIFMLLFEQTKRFFDSWLSQLINYMMVQIITAAILGLTITLFTNQANQASAGTLAADQAVFVVIIGILTVLVLTQATSIASGLSGGSTLGTGGAFGFALGRASSLGRAGLARTPLGRNLAASRDARSAGRAAIARQTGNAINESRYGNRSVPNKDPTKPPITGAAAYGIQQAARQYGLTRAVTSASTTGLQSLSRLRARVNSRPT